MIQIAIWNPPPEIRWDGTLNEWPIPWMVCSDSITGFAFVITAYLCAWIALLALAFRAEVSWVLVNSAALLAFPLSIYAYMYWMYFGK
ncbi:MAG: hypothetical protein KDB27_19630 [Planctomycetales bacterium]|nr:hypothetical protein [Planctomycetales bacterium]